MVSDFDEKWYINLKKLESKQFLKKLAFAFKKLYTFLNSRDLPLCCHQIFQITKGCSFAEILIDFCLYRHSRDIRN